MRQKLERFWSKYYTNLVYVSYWIFGLCNNFPYVIMLSAAHDILTSGEGGDGTGNQTKNATLSVPGGGKQRAFTSNKTNIYDCNKMSTGAILIADTLPGLMVTFIAPFFVHHIKYWQRILFVIVMNLSSYLLVALAKSNFLIFMGVVCASLSSSFGEITFLSLSTYYSHSLSINGWSSGTGAAGLIGSLGYAALTSTGLSPRATILTMVFIPFLLGMSYIMLPSVDFAESRRLFEDSSEKGYASIASSPVVSINISTRARLINLFNDVSQKLRQIPPLFKYMVPLFLVYFAEYLINQGFFELLYFKNGIIKEHKLQYRWYNVIYQTSVFISRSSVRCLRISFLPIFPIFQFINLAIVFSQIYLQYISTIWIVFAIIFWEGLLGGACYVNAYNLLSEEVPRHRREFSIAITSVANNIGVALAGFAAIPIHNKICSI